ncbi:MAG: hypothetical protein Kilf2KO_22140 [Rhodospirillales bacterium]
MPVLARRGLEIFALFALTYQVVSVLYPLHGALEFYYFHLGLILILVVLDLVKGRLERGRIEGQRRALLGFAALAVGALASVGYLHMTTQDIELRQPFITDLDFAAGAVMIFCVVLLTYFVWGAILSGLIVLGILYFCFGHLIPGAFKYNTQSPDIIMSYLAGMGGARGVIWGIPLSANTLFLIIVFGGLMKGTRILELFNEVGKLMLTVSRAGVAYSAILASTAIGMVTGQAVANIALSGSVTIPSMRQRGMSAEAASAVEVNASLGSQLVPPIMGLAAFLIAVNMGVPYAEIAAAAVVPALLYIAVLFIAVHFLVTASPTIKAQGEAVDRAKILWILPSFLISFATLLTLLYMRFSPGYAALWAGILLVALSVLRPKAYRPSLKGVLSGAVYGVVSAANLGLILAGIGILIQILVTSGAGFDMGRVIMAASDGEIWLALVFGMVLSLIVGLGLPTPAAYALIAIIMIPFLIDVGVGELQAHFFGFYFAIFSAITPPVAVGIMAAARISGASFYRTVLHAVRMAVVSVLIPFTFVAFPNLLAFPAITFETLLVCFALLAVSAAWAASVYGEFFGRLSRVERLLLLAGPLLYVALLVSQDLTFAVAILLLFALMAGLRAWIGRAAARRATPSNRLS